MGDGKCPEFVQDTKEKTWVCGKKLNQLPDGVTRGRPLNYSKQAAWINRKKGHELKVDGLMDQEDHMGFFNLTQVVSYKQNRLVIYSGHLFHSHSVRAEALERLTEDPRNGRLV